MAFDHLLTVGVIVVGQFLARPDVAPGANPDHFPDDLAIAVWLAAVVDEPADVAADRRIAHPPSIDGEAPDLAAFEIAPLALQAFLVIDELAVVGDDALVLVDWFECEHAPSMEPGASSADAG